jgi:hypothetical protein
MSGGHHSALNLLAPLTTAIRTRGTLGLTTTCIVVREHAWIRNLTELSHHLNTEKGVGGGGKFLFTAVA